MSQFGSTSALRLAAFGLLAAAAFSAQAQQIYRWTDSSGRTHVTDTPPPAQAKNVQKREASVPAAGAAEEPYALQQARKHFPVTLFSTPTCNGCAEARSLLNRRGIPFTEKSVESFDGLQELKKATGGDGVPALLVGSDVVKGFQEAAYDRALDVAGYPKAGLLPVRNQGAPAEAKASKASPAPAQAEPEEAPRGPYAPRPPR